LVDFSGAADLCSVDRAIDNGKSTYDFHGHDGGYEFRHYDKRYADRSDIAIGQQHAGKRSACNVPDSRRRNRRDPRESRGALGSDSTVGRKR